MDWQAMKDYYTGNSFDAYQYFGAHMIPEGVVFRTYAPDASKICIVGEFTDWEEQEMEPGPYHGVFSYHSSQAKENQMYKYRIYAQDGNCTEHCDPYGFGMELRPGNCSLIVDLEGHVFQDQQWIEQKTDFKTQPINIYEMHLGSWRQNPKRENGWYQYDELAELLIPYLKENYYTHVEFLPLSEHPFDGSWGYQNTGFFAPTSRYGTAIQLKQLIDQLHQANIGVIMDFVPVHFAIDSYGLKTYDGTALYEYPHHDVGTSEWGSYNFIHSRGEVASFLQSVANYWFEEYHIDGLRYDAVSRLIYWQGDPNRGENDTAIHFLKKMNAGLKERHPDKLLIAEDSTAYAGVTKPVYHGGLGFDYKWDLGWMHDTLELFQSAPEYRIRDYHKLTFSMAYFYSERYLLEFSHDEVVHGKATIINKMHGDYDGKFPQARTLYLYMMTHPGKKLNFMGNEFAQFREWDESREQDWDILKYPIHDAFHYYMKQLNELYQTYDALHDDDNPDGFEWIDCHQEEKCLYFYARHGKTTSLYTLINLSDQEQTYQWTSAPSGTPKLLLHSDWNQFGGTVSAKASPFLLTENNRNCMIELSVPKFSGLIFQIDQE